MIPPTEPIDSLPQSEVDDHALTGTQSMRQQLLAAREALRQSQLELRALADSILQLAWIAEQDGTMVWYNQQATVGGSIFL